MTEPQPARPVRRGRPIVAWLVVAAALALTLSAHFAPASGEQVAAVDHAADLQVRLIVGMREVGRPPAPREVEALDAGTLGQRLRFVVLAREVSGRAEAVRRLERLREDLVRAGRAPSSADAEALRVLERLLVEQAPPEALSAEERTVLEERLGWTGRLGLAPAEGGDEAARRDVLAEARRTVYVLAGAVLLAAIALLLGGAGLVAFGVLALRGRIAWRTAPPASHGLLAETFALWLVLHLVVLSAASLLATGTEARFRLAALLFPVPLLALGWLPVRGRPWSAARLDVGLHRGAGWLREAGFGVLGLVASLPVLLCSIFVMLLLAAAASGAAPPAPFEPTNPAHPVIGPVAGGGTGAWLFAMALATFGAPLIEETTFRGLLYGHLRGASAAWPRAASALVAGGVSGLVFAALHPQGLLAVPVLATLALCLSVLREWRGSLVAPMVAHGLWNGLILLALTLMVR